MANHPTGRILVIDDTEYNRHLIERQLSLSGYTVVTAIHGRQGLEYLQRQPFDTILLDLMMPEMDGFAVLEQIKRDPQLRHIPVVVISALDEIEDIVRCIEAGAEDYLTKPINTTLLHARIHACLERKWLRDQEQSRLKALQYELELGRRMQADFLPARLPHIPNWEIRATFVTVREVAGDFYDVFVLPDRRITCFLGDVCDKGVGAALFMALTRSLLRAFIEQLATVSADPLRAVAMTNDYIARHHHTKRTFSTIFCAVIDPSGGVMHYINAGHPSPFILRADGSVEMLSLGGPAIGWIANACFTVDTVSIGCGDTLFLYTDGITEARTSVGELFGEERLLTALQQAANNTALRLETVRQTVLEYSGRQQPEDDLTMLAIYRSENC